MFRRTETPSAAPCRSETLCFAKKLVVLLAFAAALAALWHGSAGFLLIVSSLALAAFFSPAVAAMERARVPAWLAALLCYLAVAAFATLAAFAVVPLVVDGVARLASLADAWLKGMQDWAANEAASGTGKLWAREAGKALSAKNALPLLREHLGTLANSAAGVSGTALGVGWAAVSGAVSLTTSAATVAVLGFLFLLERRKVWSAALELLPSRASGYLSSRSDALSGIVAGWLRGQALVAGFVAFEVYLGLWILEIFGISFDSKANLAVAAGMMTFIPFLGVPISFLPALAFALSMGGWAPVIGAAAVYGASQFVEGNFFTPWVMGRSLKMSPALALSVMLVLLSLFGILGVALAAPVAAGISLLYADWAARKK